MLSSRIRIKVSAFSTSKTSVEHEDTLDESFGILVPRQRMDARVAFEIEHFIQEVLERARLFTTSPIIFYGFKDEHVATSCKINASSHRT